MRWKGSLLQIQEKEMQAILRPQHVVVGRQMLKYVAHALLEDPTDTVRISTKNSLSGQSILRSR